MQERCDGAPMWYLRSAAEQLDPERTVKQYVGGYNDCCGNAGCRPRGPRSWARRVCPAVRRRSAPVLIPETPRAPGRAGVGPYQFGNTLSSRKRREFEGLPARIEALERVERIEHDLADLYSPWEALDSRLT